jgi:hypothetical protein
MLGNRRVSEFPMTNVSNNYKVQVSAMSDNFMAALLNDKYVILELNKYLCE